MKPVHIMKFMTQILNKVKPKEAPIVLGRWRIEKCNNKISNKIDLSNEDHCGPCGQYALEKVKLNNKRDNFSKLVQNPQNPQNK